MEKIVLTEIENKIVKLICKQMTSELIAQKLGMSRRTIETYRSEIIHKVRAKNIVGIVLYAVKKKII